MSEKIYAITETEITGIQQVSRTSRIDMPHGSDLPIDDILLIGEGRVVKSSHAMDVLIYSTYIQVNYGQSPIENE